MNSENTVRWQSKKTSTEKNNKDWPQIRNDK